MYLADENLTIESLAKSLDLSVGGVSGGGINTTTASQSLLLSTSMASSDDADKTMQMAGAEDTLTLSGIARNISEDFKKSKAAAAAVTTSVSSSSSSKRGRRGRRTSSEGGGKTKKGSTHVKSEPRDEDELEEDEQETPEDESKLNEDTGTTDGTWIHLLNSFRNIDKFRNETVRSLILSILFFIQDEPKAKKKQARASSDLETSSSTTKSTGSAKRKDGIKTENESDSQESTTHSFKLKYISYISS